MGFSFEKSVKGATKVKLAPPKTKYIEHILIATHAGEAGVGEVFRALQHRVQDSTWTTVFKGLVTVHVMIREGAPDTTLAYLSKNNAILAPVAMNDAQSQGRNIRHYYSYLTERGRAFRDTHIDWVRAKEPRLETLTVDKGLLRETEYVQHQLTALLKCDIVENDLSNEITIFVFRLLVLDLLALFHVLNQAMINILGHFFEMSKVDAERAMRIYRNFTRQTDYVVQYLSVARQHEHKTRVEVPKVKHAPVTLGRQLQEYLDDPDFEVHRRQYLAELEAKKKNKGSGSAGASVGAGAGASAAASVGAKIATSDSNAATSAAFDTLASTTPAAPAAPEPAASKPASSGGDLIDFFGSLEQTQTTIPTQPLPQQPILQPAASPWGAVPASGPMYAQPTGMFQQGGLMTQPTGFQSTNPFQAQQQQQPAFTGAGFGAFTTQPLQQQHTAFQPTTLPPIPQNSPFSVQPQPQPQPLLGMPTGQVTNPFRLSMMATGAASTPATQGQPQSVAPLVPQQTSTNPFARTSTQTAQQAFGSAAPAPLVATKTGTNPFAKDYGGAQQRPQTAGGVASSASLPPASLMPQPTGSTNPFRQSQFVNQQTGMGWQHGQQSAGLLGQIETVPVFPRPAQQWQ